MLSDKSHPSCVIFGWRVRARVLHFVNALQFDVACRSIQERASFVSRLGALCDLKRRTTMLQFIICSQHNHIRSAALNSMHVISIKNTLARLNFNNVHLSILGNENVWARVWHSHNLQVHNNCWRVTKTYFRIRLIIRFAYNNRILIFFFFCMSLRRCSFRWIKGS